jgi:hypothetical protein
VIDSGRLTFPPMTKLADVFDELNVNVGVGTVKDSATAFVMPPPVALMVTL